MRAVGIALFTLFIPVLSTAASRVTRVTRITLAPPRVTLTPGIQMKGFAPNIRPGQPPLPQRDLAVALHPRANLSSLRIAVTSGLVDTLPGRHLLPPNPRLRLLFRETTGSSSGLRWRWWGASQRVPAAYANRIYPEQVVTRQRITNRRGLLVLHLRYTPLRYRHDRAELLLDRSTAVQIRYRLRPGRAVPPDPQLQPHLGNLTNPVQARAWYGSGLSDSPPVRPGYAIVIPDALRVASKKLTAFIQHKEALGLAVTVVGDEDLSSIKVGPAGSDPERIRTWLQDNYKALNLRYVLLVGNPDPSRSGVPMKRTWAMGHDPSHPIVAPSDHYYAELTSNWDLDGDGDVAEHPDDMGDGGLDLTPEVYVGRIPVYDDNVAALDHILTKSMAYASEQGDRSWRSRVLQPAAIYWYANQYGQSSYYSVDGATVADIIFDEVIKPRGLTRTLLNEQYGVMPSLSEGDLPLDRDNLTAEWKKGYGLVTWFGHGDETSIFRTVWLTDNGDGVPGYQELLMPAFFSYDDVAQLDDTRPSFVFHAACLNGRPERADNLAYGLLRHGAVGTVAASHSAIVSFGGATDAVWGTIFGATRDFTDALLQQKTSGEALFFAKDRVNPQLEELAWFTALELNLYGDPSLALIDCSTDADCDDGDACTGAETCVLGQCVPGTPVTCRSVDPCTDARCDPAQGTCVQTPRPEGEPCEDGTFCTVNKACQGGACIGQPRCEAPGNPCVLAICDERNQTCDVYPVAEEGAVCHEGTDREGTCSSGICTPSSTGCTVPAGAPGGAPLGPLAPLFLLTLLLLRTRRR